MSIGVVATLQAGEFAGRQKLEPVSLVYDGGAARIILRSDRPDCTQFYLFNLMPLRPIAEWRLEDELGEFWAAACVGVGDVDADGVQDFVCYAEAQEWSQRGNPKLRICSFSSRRGVVAACDAFICDREGDLPVSVFPWRGSWGGATGLLIVGPHAYVSRSQTGVFEYKFGQTNIHAIGSPLGEWLDRELIGCFPGDGQSGQGPLLVAGCGPRSNHEIAAFSIPDLGVTWRVPFPTELVGRGPFELLALPNACGRDRGYIVIGAAVARAGGVQALCISSETGSIIWSRLSVDDQRCKLHGVGDVSGDGVDDVAIVVSSEKCCGDSPITLLVLDGATGRELTKWESPKTIGYYGRSSGVVAIERYQALCLLGRMEEALWLLRVSGN